MRIGSFMKQRAPQQPPGRNGDSLFHLSPYASEYLAAFDRTERFGFETPPRFLVKKDCVDMAATMPVLLDYFEPNSPAEMIGQTLAIHFALAPLLCDKTGVPFNLTIGWIVRKGKSIFQHDEEIIHRFLKGKTEAWRCEGCPFICGSPRPRARFSM
jgi:hypothetical protein